MSFSSLSLLLPLLPSSPAGLSVLMLQSIASGLYGKTPHFLNPEQMVAGVIVVIIRLTVLKIDTLLQLSLGVIACICDMLLASAV